MADTRDAMTGIIFPARALEQCYERSRLRVLQSLDRIAQRSPIVITLPFVSERHWERVAREFEDLGPTVCIAEIVEQLNADNPRYLATARRCAEDAVNEAGAFTGFAKFYRIMALDARERRADVPRISAQTLDVIGTLIEEFGEETFVLLATELLCEENSCLAQMADSFASRQPDYLTIMQGFVVLYKCLSVQAAIDGLAARYGSGFG